MDSTLNKIEFEGQNLLEILGQPKFAHFQKVQFKDWRDDDEPKQFYVSGIKANFSTYPRWRTQCISKPFWSYYLVDEDGSEFKNAYSDNSIHEEELEAFPQIDNLIQQANTYKGDNIFQDLFYISDLVDTNATADAEIGIVVLVDDNRLIWNEQKKQWNLDQK